MCSKLAGGMVCTSASCELCKKCHEFSMNGECDEESLSLIELLIRNNGANRVEPVISNGGRNTRAMGKSLSFYPILESSAEGSNRHLGI
jgi:hypothetical protein